MRSLFLKLGVLLLASSLPMHAQHVTAPPCTYDSCSLRIESGKIVRGISGVRSGSGFSVVRKLQSMWRRQIQQ